MIHSFDIEIAKKYGINEALIYNHFLFWIIKNKANEKNYKDGKYWTYSSIKALQDIFDYLSEKQIRTAINNLIDNKVLIKANYNSNPYDRTIWYAFVEEPYELSKISDTEGQKEMPKKENPNTDLDKSNCPTGQKEMPSGENHYTDMLTDVLTDNNTYTHSACETQENKNEVDILLNHTQFLSFEDFEKVYIFWFTKLTGKPITLLNQTVSARGENFEKLDWLKKNFEARKVHAGVAIFDTLEYIAQDKACEDNYRFRASNYLDGVTSRLVDAKLAKSDPVSKEGKGIYKNPSFDYFKY